MCFEVLIGGRWWWTVYFKKEGKKGEEETLDASKIPEYLFFAKFYSKNTSNSDQIKTSKSERLTEVGKKDEHDLKII